MAALSHPNVAAVLGICMHPPAIITCWLAKQQQQHALHACKPAVLLISIAFSLPTGRVLPSRLATQRAAQRHPGRHRRGNAVLETQLAHGALRTLTDYCVLRSLAASQP